MNGTHPNNDTCTEKEPSKYQNDVMERRSHLTPEEKPVFNCCQAVVSVFAKDLGGDEDTCIRAASCFGGGMQMGSVCGAITGGLMALGLAGADDPKTVNAYYRKIRANHDDMLNCRDLLLASRERGEDKMTHCNAIIRECVGYVEEALQKSQP